MSNEQLDQTGYFSAIFKHSRVNACIQLSTEGIIQCINPAFKTSFGYNNSDMEGKHFSILFTDEDRDMGKPLIEIATVLKDGQADDKNFLVHKNGKISWVSGESVRVEHDNGKTSLLKIIQDIRTEKDLETSLSRVNSFNESILNAIDDFVIILDKSLNLLQYNPAFARLFAHQGNASLKDFIGFISPYDPDSELRNKIQQVTKTYQPFTKQVIEIKTALGEKRFFEISCQMISSEATEELVLLNGHDITVQKIADAEREDLLGFVAHELRNPLASIMMGNDLLSAMISTENPQNLTSLLEKNKLNIQRLNKMVSELYNSTRVSGPLFTLDMTSFDFDNMVDEAVETFRVLHPTHQFTIEGKLHKMVMADEYRLQQVMSNYLSNAVKYSGGQPSIKIIVGDNGSSVTVGVEDKGAGIAGEQIPFLFDRFFRAEKTRGLEGIGMGLYLCRRIIQAHNGKVWVESRDGQGSLFCFNLPV